MDKRIEWDDPTGREMRLVARRARLVPFSRKNILLKSRGQGRLRFNRRLRLLQRVCAARARELRPFPLHVLDEANVLGRRRRQGTGCCAIKGVFARVNGGGQACPKALAWFSLSKRLQAALFVHLHKTGLVLMSLCL